MPTPDFIHRYFEIAFASGIGWILLWVGASIVFRRNRGKEIIPRKPEGSIFYERTASGRSNLNFFTKIGGARNCLMVAITQQELIVKPWFPFNLMFLPEIYDLEHRIPRANILRIKKGSILFWKNITIELQDADGATHSITLMLRGQDDFLKALGKTAEDS
jgi:hypothetical protein